METHFILNILGWIFLLGSWFVYFYNKKKEIELFRIQLAMNLVSLVFFGANLIIRFL